MNLIFRLRWSVAVCASVLMLAIPAISQDQEQENQFEEWQRAELRSLVEVVNAALQGQVVPTEKPFQLKADFLKGQDGTTYVPFTLTIDPAKVGSSSIAMYLFVTEHMAETAAVPDEQAEPEPVSPREALFEDAYFINVGGEPTAAQAVHISRAFTVPGGDYDVFIAVRDSAGEPSEGDPESETATVMMLKEEITVPELWNAGLQTSSVLVTELIEPIAQPLTPDQQKASPYTLGTTRILPKHDYTFEKQEELSLVFLVYNPSLTPEQMPDVTIEYTFHQQSLDGEEVFNNTNPQQFNAQTLPPGFDMSVGHQIVAGQAVPLSLFPAADYRLEIKVTDNGSGSVVTKDVSFTVQET